MDSDEAKSIEIDPSSSKTLEISLSPSTDKPKEEKPKKETPKAEDPAPKVVVLDTPKAPEPVHTVKLVRNDEVVLKALQSVFE